MTSGVCSIAASINHPALETDRPPDFNTQETAPPRFSDPNPVKVEVSASEWLGAGAMPSSREEGLLPLHLARDRGAELRSG
jgi:hypothetical protein